MDASVQPLFRMFEVAGVGHSCIAAAVQLVLAAGAGGCCWPLSAAGLLRKLQ